MAASILTNAGIASLGRIATTLIGLVVFALITRLLGPATFGSYVVMLSAATLVQLAADFGLYLTLTRDIAKHPEHEVEYTRNLLTLRLTLLIALFAIFLISSPAIPTLRSLLPALSIITLGFIAQSISQLYLGVFQTRSVIWRATAGDVSGRLTQLVAIIVLPVFVAPLTAAVIAFTAGTLIALLVHHVLLPTRRVIRLAFKWSLWRQVIRVSWPLGAFLLLNAIYFRIDLLMLDFFRPATEVGLYGAAYRLIEHALFFPAMLGGLLLPRFAEAIKGQPKSPGQAAPAARLFGQSLHLVAVFVGLFLLMLLFFAQPILSLIAGPQFADASPLLRILSVALVVMFFGQIIGFALVAYERQRFLLMLYATLAVFNVVANLLVIPTWGAAGAAWTTVATEALAVTAALLAIRQQFELRLNISRLSALVITLGASLLVGSALPASLSWVVQALIVAAVYALAATATGLTRRQTVSLLFARPT